MYAWHLATFPRILRSKWPAKATSCLHLAAKQCKLAKSPAHRKLSSIANYLMSRAWAMLQDSDVCWRPKQRMLVERLKKLGMKSMAEATRRWVLALLYCTVPSLPQADAVYDQAQELKGCFSTCPGPSDDRPYIVKFPDDAQQQNCWRRLTPKSSRSISMLKSWLTWLVL